MVANNMADIETEVSRLVLVRGDTALELKPQNSGGVELLQLTVNSLGVGLNDGRLVESPFSLPVLAPSTNSRLTLARARTAYRNEPNSPECLADYMEYFWKNRRIKLGVSVSSLAVDTCPWNEDQIAKFRGVEALSDKAEGVRDIVRFIPEVVAGDLELIKRGFPEINFYLYGGLINLSDIKNEYVLKGWGRSEAEIDAPYTDTTEQGLKDIFVSLGRQGLTVPAYAIFGVFSRDFTKKYLDQIRTIIRTVGSVKGSSEAGRVLDARFNPVGYLYVSSDWNPGDRNGSIGGRSFQGA